MISPRLIILQATPYCNIKCSYCYLAHRDDRRVMSDAVIDAVADKILRRLAPDAAPAIVWHAGEPTAAPVSWYRRAYSRLRPAAPAGTSFAMQTNGVAIHDRWIDLFRDTSTHVSVSIDGPQRFHDARRRTRNDRPTWHLAMRGLKRLQEAGLRPKVISVLHPDGLASAREYCDFYRENDVTDISLSIDELEGFNRQSSFARRDYKPAMVAFMAELMRIAYRDEYPLRIREVERISQILLGTPSDGNEQVEPWAAIVVAANGNVSTYSPEFMEVDAPAYDQFVFGNLLSGEIEDFTWSPGFRRAAAEIAAGVAACRETCRYFAVCGGGSPVNKLCERNSLVATETDFCRLGTQAAADAFLSFLRSVPTGERNPPKTAGCERLVS